MKRLCHGASYHSHCKKGHDTAILYAAVSFQNEMKLVHSHDAFWSSLGYVFYLVFLTQNGTTTQGLFMHVI